MNKQGYAHLVVGGTGSGKTTFVKSILGKVPNRNSIMIYDVNCEYFADSKLPDFKEFTEKLTRVKNSVIVLEEATIFLDARGSSFDLREVLVRKRHNENYIILVFHALRFVPMYVFNLCNYLTLLNTNDNIQNVSSKFDERIVGVFSEVQKANTKYFRRTIRLDQ